MAVASAAGALLLGACGDFNVTNPNQPTLDDLLNNPTRGKLSSAATGLLIATRTDVTTFIWTVGSTGREGVNLLGNNQPDYQEPYFGPLQSGGSIGPGHWNLQYQAIRSANVYLSAVPKVVGQPAPNGLTAEEGSASLGYGKTLKAINFLYVIMTHGNTGAPVDVDQAVDAPPAPFVPEDSVYGYILGLLNDAQNDLTAAGTAAFPFPLPSGFAGFDTPATFLKFNRALAAKAYLLRATAANSSCAGTCYASALTALGASFINPDPATFADGVYYNFSAGAGDTENELSDPLDGPNFFALPILKTLSQKQPGGADDQRAIDKIAPKVGPDQILGGIPIPGNLKFTMYLTGGDADVSHPIPIIRNEELLLLRAEAKLGQNDLAGAIADINVVRTNAGKLAPYAGPSTPDAVLTELLYNRRYSLLWEQGTTWIDARRFGRIVNGYIQGIGELPGFNTNGIPPSSVPLRFPVPSTECNARGLPSDCSPLGT
jgi:hypothetical protein